MLLIETLKIYSLEQDQNMFWKEFSILKLFNILLKHNLGDCDKDNI